MSYRAKIFITKSRSGHYTATAILNGVKRSQGKLDTVHHARAAAADLRVQVSALAARVARC